MTASAPADARAQTLALASALRAGGVEVSTGQVLACVEALRVVEAADHGDFLRVARCALVCRRTDVAVFDDVAAALYAAGELRLRVDRSGSAAPGGRGVEPRTGPRSGAQTTDIGAARDGGRPDGGREDAAGDSDPSGGDSEVTGVRASAVERLRRRRFDQVTADELRAMRRLMAAIPLHAPRRRTARTAPSRRGRRLDLRRTARDVLHTDGEVLRRAWRTRRSRPRPLVLLLDVSGSMAGYSRALLQFAYSARRRLGRVEVFCFGTRLTRVTHALAGGAVDDAVAAAAAHVVDWDGGTRIGASVADLNRRYGRTGALRGAVVLVCSDGLERGDPRMLGAEMARLARHAHRVVWVNPLAGDPRFAPVQQGMRAAAPSVDRLVAGHDLASLEALAGLLRSLDRTD